MFGDGYVAEDHAAAVALFIPMTDIAIISGRNALRHCCTGSVSRPLHVEALRVGYHWIMAQPSRITVTQTATDCNPPFCVFSKVERSTHGTLSLAQSPCLSYEHSGEVAVYT